jgi:hypothetical protein
MLQAELGGFDASEVRAMGAAMKTVANIVPTKAVFDSTYTVTTGTDPDTHTKVQPGDMIQAGGATAAALLPALGVAGELGAAKNIGRAGRQERLAGIATDEAASSADRGWIKNELRQIEHGNRDTIRNPPGKDLAHERGREAAKGYSYEHSNLQSRDLHKTQHKFDDFGRANKERPVKPNE